MAGVTKWLHGDQEVEAIAPSDAVTTRTLPGGDIELQLKGRTITVPVARDERGTVWIGWQGRSFVFTPVAPGRKRPAGRKSGSLSAPMTGVVADVLVTVGQHVNAYQPLALVEAMKVLATLEAPFAGVVTAVHAQKNDRVEHGAVLVEIEPA